MRVIWNLMLIASSVCASSILKNADELTQSSPSINNTDNSLNSQCSQFVKSCLESCEQETIGNFSSTCSSRDASCTCNNIDISSKIFNTMLRGIPGAITTDKKKLQVENNHGQRGVKDLLRSVQFNAVLGEVDQQTNELDKLESEQAEEEEEEAMYSSSEETESGAERELQNMEYIYPNPTLAANTLFQENYCTHFLIRCKQDCPAAFNSYSCDTNIDQTGFLLSCVCNTVDIAASVDAQVQAEI